MPPKYRKRFVLLFLALVISSAAFQTVQACVCPDGDDSTLGKFKSARFVVVNKIVPVYKEPKLQIVSNSDPEICLAVVHDPFVLFREIGTNKLPEAVGTIKLPERQINGSSYKAGCYGFAGAWSFTTLSTTLTISSLFA